MTLYARIILFLVIAFGSVATAYADGSKDMYPAGVKGNRAFLVAKPISANRVLLNQAAHYVYARLDETIAVAFSGQGYGDGHIILTAPNGVKYQTAIGSLIGRIAGRTGQTNREAELAGPRDGYDAFERRVLPDQEGVWKIEFVPPGATATTPLNVYADEEWTQPVDRDQIAAWDVSVRDVLDTYWIRGRVFAHVLNLHLNNSIMDNPSRAFYGENYVLTKDGYIYKVSGNGSHGIDFFYFVNNSGLLDAQGRPSYKSSDLGERAPFHNPNAPDNNLNVTQKMFYTFPDVEMPTDSPGAVSGGTTWLYQETQIAEIKNISLGFVEGNRNYVNKKGAYIQFETNYPGRYKIVIASQSDDHPFSKREIIEEAIAGSNKIWWDGLDGDSNFVPIGRDYPISISVALIEGEIHFPYFDMEINPQGIRIDRINPDGSDNGPAMVYWDDSEITPSEIESEQSNPLVNLNGLYSDVNGHAWGSYRKSTMPGGTSADYNGNYGAHSFGNARAMDTWSYAAHMTEEIEETITVEIADLEIVNVVADKDTIELGDVVTYTVVVRNNGPSDALGAPFEYDLPLGFYILSVTRSSDCSTLVSQQVVNNRVRSVLNLPNGCTITYRIQATTGASVPDATYGFVPAVAGIVRPIGFIDPDATSSDPEIVAPGAAAEECEGTCNNIKVNADVFLLEPYHERGQLALLKTVRHLDSNGSGFQEEGEQLEYTFTIRNIGFVRVSNIYIDDKMLLPILPGPLVPPVSVLDPGGETVLTYRYTITSADVARLYVENTALVFGTNPRGFDVKDVSGTGFDNDRPTRIDIDQQPTFAMTKKVVNKGTGENGQFTLGDKIVYRFDIKHGGSVPVGDIRINDQNISPDDHEMGSLVLSNQEVHHQLEYIITADDILRGQVENTATLSGEDRKYGNILTDISGQTFEDDLPTVTVLAKAPTGVEDTFVIYQGQSVLFDVLANDIAGSSSIHSNSIEVVSNPASGTLVRQNGKLLYVPVNNFVYGEDSFVYRFMDRSRLSSQDTEVKISILRTIPVTVDDHYRVGYNYWVKLRPYENDYVEHSELLRETIRITAYPSYGDIKDLGNGIFEYRPHVNYTGYDVLKYIIQDRNGNWSEEATVHIEVLGFFLPNTITPNGDGKNDTFQVLGTYKFDYVELEVINRFGQRIFYSTDYKNDWVVPENIPEGTYFYIFKGVKNSEKPVVRRGSILLKRETFRF